MKNVYTIPPDAAFVNTLADGLFRESEGDPLKLADGLILLPTRRACLHLRESFRQRMKGRAALLPRMQPLGDLDEEELYFTANADVNPDIPPAITPLRRQLLLAQLIARKDPGMPLDQAAQLAEALAQLLDEVQVERRDFSGLGKLVEEKDLAEHWLVTVEFLKILTENWPGVLKDEGCIDPAARRNRVLEAQAATWRANPPSARVIAAGSTGSVPATADLLDVIAGLPNGAVILPGLDQNIDEEAWQAIAETHPQYGMKQLLEKFGVKRAEVKIWPDEEKEIRAVLSARTRLLQEAMRPAEVSEGWRDLQQADIPPEALAGLTRLDLDHPQEEAQAIALVMREALERPGKTAALVTPDRALAERVSILLGRWGIKINDSGGTSLAALPTGGFLTDVMRAAAPGATPVDYLSLLKHPFAACGLSPAECRVRARQMEVNVWRNPDFGNHSLDQDNPDPSQADFWTQQFKELLQPIAEKWHTSLPLVERIQAHINLAELIAASDEETGPARLWRNEEGEISATWLNDLQIAARDFPPLTGAAYMELFAGLLRTVTVRPVWGLHPRLSILGPLEARLIHADLIILGGLNEGVWPPEAKADPWMSRPMKKDFGLPLPERRIGLSAHDFVQFVSASEVILTRARRIEGAPSVPSRFLLQLEAVLRALGYSDDKRSALDSNKPWQSWVRMLDEPPEIMPCAKPQPKPPAESRPRQLSVTEIGTWRRNPYAIYARHILKLRKLDPLDIEIDAAERGIMIHEALDVFIKKYPQDLPESALDELLNTGRGIFAGYAEHPQVQAFWWPRFERIAGWFIDEERRRRAEGIKVLATEAKGQFTFDGFTLRGRADRIDLLPDGGLAIADYKTGFAPSNREVAAGYEPQLPLLALLALCGGFDGVGATSISELAYWKLNGGRVGSEIKPVSGNMEALAEKAHAGLERLIDAFADPATPYQAVPKPELQPRYDDYAHLARLQEWGRTEEDA